MKKGSVLSARGAEERANPPFDKGMGSPLQIDGRNPPQKNTVYRSPPFSGTVLGCRRVSAVKSAVCDLRLVRWARESRADKHDWDRVGASGSNHNGASYPRSFAQRSL